jgi:hypothetical protein
MAASWRIDAITSYHVFPVTEVLVFQMVQMMLENWDILPPHLFAAIGFWR